MSEPYINALDYVTGSGMDHVAVQAALDACHAQGGGTVVLPRGVWTFGGTCWIHANTRLVMYGAYVTCDELGLPLFANYDPLNPTQPPGYTGEGRITVEGGVLDMRADVNPVASNVFTFAHCEDITLRDVTVLNVSSYHAVEPHSARRVRMIDCNFFGWRDYLSTPQREAIQVDSINMPGDDGTPCEDITIRDCHFGPSDVCGGWGTAIGSHTNGPTAHRGVRFVGNTCEDMLTYGVRAHGWSDISIKGNTFRGVGDAAVLVQTAIGGQGTVPGSVADVSHNTIETCGTNGIRFEAEGTDRFSDITVADNRIRYCGSNAINLADVDWGQVDHNVIRDTADNYGIQLGLGDEHTVTGLMVHANIIYNAMQAGIRMNGALKCQVTRNRVRGGAGGVSTLNANNGSTVIHNHFEGNSWTAAVAMQGSGWSGVKTAIPGGSALPGDNLI